AGQHTDEADPASDTDGIERLRECSCAADFDDMIDARKARQVARLATPIRCRLIVDDIRSAEIAHAFELFITARCRDDARSKHPRELQREDRNAAGPLN